MVSYPYMIYLNITNVQFLVEYIIPVQIWYLSYSTFTDHFTVISRSPMDIIQLKGIVEAAMGFKQLNVLPYQLEYEILLIW